MITTKILGGLGNQLCAYACGYSIAKERNEELVLDVSDYFNGYFRPYMLDWLNIPSHRKLTYKHVSESMLTPKVIPQELSNTYEAIADQYSGIETREQLLDVIKDSHNSYLIGDWGLNYCTGYEEEIRGIISPAKPSDFLIKFKERIANQNSTAIHVRRTDFVDLGVSTSGNYYKAAIAYIESKYPNSVFYIFSDDMEWIKSEFGSRKNYNYIHINGGISSDLDEFFCISYCNNRILSNQSSFGLWASFLNNSIGKTDIIHKNSKTFPSDAIVELDDSDVIYWMQKYKDMPIVFKGYSDINSIKLSIEERLENNDNKEAMKLLDEVSFDSFGVKTKDYTDFLCYTGIAYAQMNELEEAENCFYRQKQYSDNEADFHLNYQEILNKLGKKSEGAIHAAMAAKLSKDELMYKEFEKYFKEDKLSHYIYNTVYKIPVRHFIVAPSVGWFNYVKHIQTIAVLLARMGNKVSCMNIPMQQVKSNSSIKEVSKYIISRKTKCTEVYSYGIDYYQSVFLEKDNDKINCSPEIIKQLCDDSIYKPYVIARNPDAIDKSCQERTGKIFFVDFDDPMDHEKLCYKETTKLMAQNMYKYCDLTITSDINNHNKIIEEYGKNKSLYYKPLSQNKSPLFEYIDEPIGVTHNYLNYDYLMELAAVIMGATREEK